MNSTRGKERSRNPKTRTKRSNLLSAYQRYLERLSAAFRRRVARVPEQIACRAGCFGCCVGLFEISPLDAAVAARGLAKLRPAIRRRIKERARQICQRIASIFPGDPESGALDLAREAEWDAFFEKTSGVACPFLVPLDAGHRPADPADPQELARRENWPCGFTCAIYEHRPHTCRTFGLPLKQRGEIVAPACELNLAGATISTLKSMAFSAVQAADLALARSAERHLRFPAGGATILPLVAAGFSAWGSEAPRLSARTEAPSRRTPGRRPLPRSSEQARTDRPAPARRHGSRSVPRPGPSRGQSR
jgi:hypothetical protein